MNRTTLATGAALALTLTLNTMAASAAQPPRTGAEACSLINSLTRGPDPFTATTPTAARAAKQALKIARAAWPVLCPGTKTEALTAADGSQYFGQSQAGAAEGRGVRFYADGSRYIGQWKAGARQGEGVLIKADGSRYVGTWADDKPKGQGVLQIREMIQVKVLDSKAG